MMCKLRILHKVKLSTQKRLISLIVNSIMGKRSISPDEWIYRALGLTPHRTEWHMVQSVYSAVMIGVLCSCLYLTPGLTTQHTTRMQVDIYNLQIKFTFGCSLAAIGLSYWNYHSGLQLIEELKEIDIISGTRMKRRFPLRLAIELAYMLGLCALEVTVSYPSPNVAIASLLFLNMYHGFTAPKVMIDRYTRHINGVTSRFCEATNKLQQGEFKTEIIAHSKLINSASQVSSVFGLEILLVLSIESCLIVYNLYNFRPLLEAFQKDNQSTSIFIFISILWLISWFSDVWHIISTTEEMLKQSKSFNETLLRQIIEDPTGELGKQETVKLHVAMKKEVIITAFGFFTIDGTFLYNLAAITTTYLVILTQFKAKEN